MLNSYIMLYSIVPIVEWYNWCAKHILSIFYSVLSLTSPCPLYISLIVRLSAPFQPQTSLSTSHIKPTQNLFLLSISSNDVVDRCYGGVLDRRFDDVIGYGLVGWGFRLMVG